MREIYSKEREACNTLIGFLRGVADAMEFRDFKGDAQSLRDKANWAEVFINRENAPVNYGIEDSSASSNAESDLMAYASVFAKADPHCFVRVSYSSAATESESFDPDELLFDGTLPIDWLRQHLPLNEVLRSR